jgi:hypothetical protein
MPLGECPPRGAAGLPGFSFLLCLSLLDVGEIVTFNSGRKSRSLSRVATYTFACTSSFGNRAVLVWLQGAASRFPTQINLAGTRLCGLQTGQSHDRLVTRPVLSRCSVLNSRFAASTLEGLHHFLMKEQFLQDITGQHLMLSFEKYQNFIID